MSNPARSNLGPFGFVRAGWQHRTLIRRLAIRKTEARYRGSALGLLWSLLNPLLMLGVYTFVFSVIFRARWDSDVPGEVALLVFSGLILFSVLARCLSEAPSLMDSHRSYIKQVVFPAEALAWVSVLVSLFDFAVGLGLLGVVYVAVLGVPPITVVLTPLILLPLVLLTLGAVWLFSSLGVFLRDLAQVVGVLTTALLFLSPIFYPITRIPDAFRDWYALNPLANLVEMFRGLLFEGISPDWVTWGALAAISWLVAWLGFAWFESTKKSFADVL